MTDAEKKVDLDWKERAKKEQEELEQKIKSRQNQEGKRDFNHENSQLKKADFLNYISDLSIQGMIFLGLVENPVSQKIEKNLENVQYIIGVLEMMEEKTKGNLNEVEKKALGQILYQLRMAYVEQCTKENTEESSSKDQPSSGDKKV